MRTIVGKAILNNVDNIAVGAGTVIVGVSAEVWQVALSALIGAGFYLAYKYVHKDPVPFWEGVWTGFAGIAVGFFLTKFTYRYIGDFLQIPPGQDFYLHMGLAFFYGFMTQRISDFSLNAKVIVKKMEIGTKE